MPDEEHDFLEVATEEKFSKQAVYILYGWTDKVIDLVSDAEDDEKALEDDDDDEITPPIFVIYVGSTTKGSEGGRYGKRQFIKHKVKNPIRTDLHRFSEEDWEDGATVKFTKRALRAYENRMLKAIKKICPQVLNKNRASRCCLDGKCRGNGCTVCCGVKLPTELPRMGEILKKLLNDIAHKGEILAMWEMETLAMWERGEHTCEMYDDFCLVCEKDQKGF